MHASEFDAVVEDTIARLPAWVRDAFDNIDLLILDEAGDDLDPDAEGLLGLYVGTPLPERDANHAGELPDVVYLFRRPHIELGLCDDDLRNEIATTLVHEIAHYFGLDDDRLHELGWG